jgi:hypothetical protein
MSGGVIVDSEWLKAVRAFSRPARNALHDTRLAQNVPTGLKVRVFNVGLTRSTVCHALEESWRQHHES